MDYAPREATGPRAAKPGEAVAFGKVTFTVNSTEGFTGRCFLTGMSISVAIGSPIEVNLTVQGTGDVSIT